MLAVVHSRKIHQSPEPQEISLIVKLLDSGHIVVPKLLMSASIC